MLLQLFYSQWGAWNKGQVLKSGVVKKRLRTTGLSRRFIASCQSNQNCNTCIPVFLPAVLCFYQTASSVSKPYSNFWQHFNAHDFSKLMLWGDAFCFWNILCKLLSSSTRDICGNKHSHSPQRRAQRKSHLCTARLARRELLADFRNAHLSIFDSHLVRTSIGAWRAPPYCPTLSVRSCVLARETSQACHEKDDASTTSRSYRKKFSNQTRLQQFRRNILWMKSFSRKCLLPPGVYKNFTPEFLCETLTCAAPTSDEIEDISTNASGSSFRI